MKGLDELIKEWDTPFVGMKVGVSLDYKGHVLRITSIKQPSGEMEGKSDLGTSGKTYCFKSENIDNIFKEDTLTRELIIRKILDSVFKNMSMASIEGIVKTYINHLPERIYL